jgi:hypothetical protein
MPVLAIVIVALNVIGPVIVAVHLNGNAPVRVIETVPCLVQDVQPGTWVTFQTGHMGDGFSALSPPPSEAK